MTIYPRADGSDGIAHITSARLERIAARAALADELAEALRRSLPYVEADARMMGDITRHSPLDPEAQAKHDSTEYDSERLVDEIPALLARYDAAERGKK